MDHLILVDGVHPVPDDHAPKLVKCGDVMLEETAAEWFVKMIAEAAGEGVKLRCFSGYRSAEYQQRLFMNSVYDHVAQGLRKRDAIALTERYVAKPGHSEHQTGLACDICREGLDDADESFALTREGLWLNENAAGFGFILRYPRMKEHITGIAFEPWHYRYVGREHSAAIMTRGYTLEEYLYYNGIKNANC